MPIFWGDRLARRRRWRLRAMCRALENHHGHMDVDHESKGERNGKVVFETIKYWETKKATPKNGDLTRRGIGIEEDIPRIVMTKIRIYIMNLPAKIGIKYEPQIDWWLPCTR